MSGNSTFGPQDITYMQYDTSLMPNILVGLYFPHIYHSNHMCAVTAWEVRLQSTRMRLLVRGRVSQSTRRMVMELCCHNFICYQIVTNQRAMDTATVVHCAPC
jgi:hypothetical protein